MMPLSRPIWFPKPAGRKPYTKSHTTLAPTNEIAIGRKMSDFEIDSSALAHLVGERGEPETEDNGHGRHHQDPDDAIADPDQVLALGEERHEVVEPDETFAVAIPEGQDRRVDRRVHEIEAEKDERRADEHERANTMSRPLRKQVDQLIHAPIESPHPSDADNDGNDDLEDLVDILVLQELEREEEHHELPAGTTSAVRIRNTQTAKLLSWDSWDGSNSDLFSGTSDS